MQNRDGHGVDHGHNHMLATILRILNWEEIKRQIDRQTDRHQGDGDSAHKALTESDIIKHSDLNQFYSQPENPTNTIYISNFDAGLKDRPLTLIILFLKLARSFMHLPCYTYYSHKQSKQCWHSKYYHHTQNNIKTGRCNMSATCSVVLFHCLWLTRVQ